MREPLAEEGQPLLGDPEQLLGVPLEEGRSDWRQYRPRLCPPRSLAQLVERPGVDHDDVRREPRRVLEDPQPAAVVAVEHHIGALLLSTVHSAGALTWKPCTALRSGWSKHAQARRAPSGSKVVQT